MRNISLICFFVFFCENSFSQGVNPEVTTFNIYKAKAIAVSYGKFSSVAKDLECFEVYILNSESEISVNFLPKDLIETKDEKIILRQNDLENCGFSKSYIFDNRGIYLREMINR